MAVRQGVALRRAGQEAHAPLRRQAQPAAQRPLPPRVRRPGPRAVAVSQGGVRRGRPRPQLQGVRRVDQRQAAPPGRGRDREGARHVRGLAAGHREGALAEARVHGHGAGAHQHDGDGERRRVLRVRLRRARRRRQAHQRARGADAGQVGVDRARQPEGDGVAPVPQGGPRRGDGGQVPRRRRRVVRAREALRLLRAGHAEHVLGGARRRHRAAGGRLRAGEVHRALLRGPQGAGDDGEHGGGRRPP
mmetsp:Transcript_25463/g.87238  ORF Transcript_25463/g.87238 Transcript_25463/m.87238 type:complete len:247 (-) Transcript_25463:410-1150(-)